MERKRIPLEDLSEDARRVLFIVIEAFREKIVPDMDPVSWRKGALHMMERGHARIVEDGDVFKFQVTPEGREWLASQE